MYTHRIIHVPAVGKSGELRAALLERNASGNAEAPHALAVHLFSPQPGFVHSIRFENLAALEAYANRPQITEPAFQLQARRIDACLAQERVSVLYEELAGTQARVDPRYLIRNRFSPAPGKGPELRAVLEERVLKASPAGLAAARLSRQVASLDGPAFAVTLLFGSMADIDQFRAAEASDPTFPPFLAKVASLCRAPVQQRMQRILAPFPR